MSEAETPSAEQIAELRAQLLRAREEAEVSLSASREDARPVSLDLSIGRLTRMDALQQQQMAAAQRRRLELRLEQIRQALRRIEAGTYGECLRCEEPIDLARLRARPEAPMCRSCQGGLAR